METPKEDKKERQRKAALANLHPSSSTSTLVDLSVAYQIHNSNKYGEAIEAPVEEILYNRNLGSVAVSGLFRDGFNATRQGGRRYSGTMSEYGLLEQANEIIMGSIMQLQVSDIVGLIGSKSPLKKKYQGKYLGDLDKKEVGEIAGGYVNFLIQDRLQKVIATTKGMTQGGLEKFLCAEEKKEE